MGQMVETLPGAICADRCIDDFIVVPASLTSVGQGLAAAAEFPRPSFHALRDTVRSHELVVSPIGALDDSICPSAVRWLIVSVGVNAIERSSWWAVAHIDQKVFEVRLPFVTDIDPSSPVVVKANGIRIVTTCHHREPRNVFRSAGQSVSPAIITGAVSFRAQTPTRSDLPASNVRPPRNLLTAAVACEFPITVRNIFDSR
jgi:hypothetical protein